MTRGPEGSAVRSNIARIVAETSGRSGRPLAQVAGAVGLMTMLSHAWAK